MRRKIFNKKTNKELKSIAAAIALKNVRDFTYSNTIGILEEEKRYEKITDYFAKKSNRERYNNFNTRYLNEIFNRLSEIKRETIPISNLCSKLLKRFEAGII